MLDRVVSFSMTLSDHNPGFKVTVYLQVEYLKGATKNAGVEKEIQAKLQGWKMQE